MRAEPMPVDSHSQLPLFGIFTSEGWIVRFSVSDIREKLTLFSDWQLLHCFLEIVHQVEYGERQTWISGDVPRSGHPVIPDQRKHFGK